MINAIHGKLISSGINHVDVLTSGGVEYHLECSTNAVMALKKRSVKDEGGDIRVLCTLVHREDAMLLYGFADEKERLCFSELVTVNGIGPRQAVKILSAITVEDFVRALDAQDVKKLSKIPGIGAKTGQKLILQLRNVLVLDEEGEDAGSGGSSHPCDEFADIVQAFVEMGHDKKRVREKIDRLLSDNQLLLYGKSHEEKETFLFSTLIKGV